MSQGFWAKNDFSLNKKMPKNHSKNLQALNRAKIFVDCKPAELHKGKEWRVKFFLNYYIFN